ncbi:MAG: hypothetical protein NZM31_12495, partial [Gemmatales bacterium]|nr:hypothetical protein [Gemmatales bacterium]MDW8387814.1 hypothetical protein [Gemmatales bacterium]
MEISEHRTPQAADLGQATNRPTAWLHVVLLLGILLAGLLLRLQEMGNPLQQDEFGPLYAVVEREGRPPGYTASADMPLVPVKSWQEVRKRSILP